MKQYQYQHQHCIHIQIPRPGSYPRSSVVLVFFPIGALFLTSVIFDKASATRLVHPILYSSTISMKLGKCQVCLACHRPCLGMSSFWVTKSLGAKDSSVYKLSGRGLVLCVNIVFLVKPVQPNEVEAKPTDTYFSFWEGTINNKKMEAHPSKE